MLRQRPSRPRAGAGAVRREVNRVLSREMISLYLTSTTQNFPRNTPYSHSCIRDGLPFSLTCGERWLRAPPPFVFKIRDRTSAAHRGLHRITWPAPASSVASQGECTNERMTNGRAERFRCFWFGRTLRTVRDGARGSPFDRGDVSMSFRLSVLAAVLLLVGCDGDTKSLFPTPPSVEAGGGAPPVGADSGKPPPARDAGRTPQSDGGHTPPPLKDAGNVSPHDSGTPGSGG